MWSNDAVADDPEDASPWTRDDWVPDSAVPDENVFGIRQRSTVGRPSAAEPPPEDFDGPDSDARAPGSSAVRRVVAAGVVIALLVGSAGALLRDDGGPEGAPDASGVPADVVTSVPAAATPDTIPATSVSVVDVPVSPEPGDPGDPGDPVELPGVPPIVVGDLPAWAERTISVPGALAAMAPTEVVTLDQSGIINVTQFPSGRTRSIDASRMGAELQLIVGDGTIVVFDSTRLLQIRDGEAVVETLVPDGIIYVQPWTGAGSFIVTSPATGPATPERDWVLRPDGALELLDNRFTEESSFFARVFSPDGDALVTAPGGVYAVDAGGNATRINPGTLIATGERHWAVEECDEALRCAYSVVEWATGTVTPGSLDPVARLGVHRSRHSHLTGWPVDRLPRGRRRFGPPTNSRRRLGHLHRGRTHQPGRVPRCMGDRLVGVVLHRPIPPVRRPRDGDGHRDRRSRPRPRRRYGVILAVVIVARPQGPHDAPPPDRWTNPSGRQETVERLGDRAEIGSIVVREA